jgi:RNAse (barnase) inhibitor barstar
VDVIELDGAAWRTVNDFYTSYLAAVGAPVWHGRNLDALWDSLTAGGINQRSLPFRIRISGITRMSPEAREIARRFEALVREAVQEGHGVGIDLLP